MAIRSVRALKGATLLLGLAMTAPFAIWALPLPVLGIALVTWAAVTRRSVKWKLLVMLAGLAVFGHGAPPTLRQVQARADLLADHLARTETLSRWEMVQVASLNVLMAVGGLAMGYPEVALETVFLFVPNGGERRWRSDFAMESLMVRQAVDDMATRARRSLRGDAPVVLAPHVIAWSSASVATDSRRVALALNSPLRLSGTARCTNGAMRLSLQGSAAARYPPRSRTHLGRFIGQALFVEEGLFAHLQTRGWLHPYTATYTWDVERDLPECRSAQGRHWNPNGVHPSTSLD